jgi:putative hemolysin
MEILIILLLVLLNGVFSMSEIALVSSRKARLEAAVRARKKGAATALELSQSPNQFLSTVQIGITLIGLLTGIYSGETLAEDLTITLQQFEPVRDYATSLAVTIILIGITFLSLILGELVPKRIGLTNPEGISRALAPVMKVLSKITLPFVWILSKASDFVLKILNVKKSPENRITEEEIKSIIHEGTQGGEIQAIEEDIVERVFLLGDRKISSLMTPRTDVTFLNIESPFEELRQTVNEDLHRIYPVYQNDKDNLLGIVRLKDLFLAFQNGRFDILAHIIPPNYLIESTSAYRALENFRKSRVHYALVTNEYGLVIGIVTMDDILKALVGDIGELNSDDYQLIKRDDDTYLVDGQYPLSEFFLYFDIDPGKSFRSVNTIAGLILRELHHIPAVGDKIQWRDFEFEVIDMDNIKIDKLLIRRK